METALRQGAPHQLVRLCLILAPTETGGWSLACVGFLVGMR